MDENNTPYLVESGLNISDIFGSSGPNLENYGPGTGKLSCSFFVVVIMFLIRNCL